MVYIVMYQMKFTFGNKLRYELGSRSHTYTPYAIFFKPEEPLIVFTKYTRKIKSAAVDNKLVNIAHTIGLKQPLLTLAVH